MNHTVQIDQLQIEVYENRSLMGEAAGKAAADKLRELLAEQDEVRVIFAAAPSQNEVLAYLKAASDIDWSRVTAFHMDEYIGLPADAPQRFSRFLERGLFQHVPFKAVHLINSAGVADEECARYGALLQEAPIDLVCLGIGENGHIAFNDPGVADFEDPQVIKVAELDLACRQQQVNDGCFAELKDVPAYALTLTIPTLFSGRYLVCTVPGPTKRNAMQALRTEAIHPDMPATILRKHSACRLFTDREAYGDE